MAAIRKAVKKSMKRGKQDTEIKNIGSHIGSSSFRAWRQLLWPNILISRVVICSVMAEAPENFYSF